MVPEPQVLGMRSLQDAQLFLEMVQLENHRAGPGLLYQWTNSMGNFDVLFLQWNGQELREGPCQVCRHGVARLNLLR